MIGRWMTVLAAVAGTALSASAQAKDKEKDKWTDEEYVSRIDTVLPLARNGSVEVRLQGGDVVVTGASRTNVRILGTSERGELRVDASPSHIDIGTRGARRHTRNTRVEVTVPYGTRVTVANQSGDVSVRDTRGELDLTTTSGDVIIEDVATRVEFTTMSGDVEVRRVEGLVRGETMSGEVLLEDIRGEVDLETVSGDLSMRNIRSSSVRAESVSGSLEYAGVTERGGRYDFASHSGDVRLVLPQSLGALIAVETFSGTIDSDFPITLQPGQRHGKQYEFQVGDGGARIGASSFSGGIYLQRGAGRGQE